MIKQLLVPVDGSEHSNKALEFACALADKFACGLHILHVADAPTEERFIAMGSALSSVEAARRAIEESSKHILDEASVLAEATGSVVASSEILIGDPTRQILQYIEKHSIDTIVMGSRGLSNLSGMLLGSVSHKVGNLADCTCITVR